MTNDKNVKSTKKKVENKKNSKVVKEEKVIEVKKEKIGDNTLKNINVALLVISCILLIVVIFLISKGKQIELKDGKQVIASVTGKEITAEELFDELKRQYGTNILVNTIDDFIVNKEIKDDDAAQKYAKAQLDALKQQYEASGYKFEDVIASYGYDSENDLLKVFISDYKKNKIAEDYLKEKVTDDEINKYYENEVYGKYTAKHILIKPVTKDSMTEDEKKQAEEAAKKKAQEVIEKLNNGANWADLVKEYSNDEGSKDDEGLIKDFEKDSVVDEFFQSTVKLKDGEYSKEPVKSDYGYHVILRINAGKKPELKDVKDEVISSIVTQKLEEDTKLADTTWVEIRKKYKINITDSRLQKVYESIIKG